MPPVTRSKEPILKAAPCIHKTLFATKTLRLARELLPAVSGKVDTLEQSLRDQVSPQIVFQGTMSLLHAVLKEVLAINEKRATETRRLKILRGYNEASDFV